MSLVKRSRKNTLKTEEQTRPEVEPQISNSQPAETAGAEGRPVDMELVESVMKIIRKMDRKDPNWYKELAEAIEESGEWKHYL